MNKTHTVFKKHDNLFGVLNVILNYQHRTMQSQRSNSQKKRHVSHSTKNVSPTHP